jgi:hypothetical protein
MRINHKKDEFEIIVNTSEGSGTFEEIMKANPRWFEAVINRLDAKYKTEEEYDTIE